MIAREKLLEFVVEKELLDLAKKLIQIPSLEEEEGELAEFLTDYMRKNGLDVEIQEVENGRVQPIGRLKGSGGGQSLLFNGHMDTDVIFLGAKDPFVPKIRGRRLYGHGILNMKCGVAAMLIAAAALNKAGVRLKGDLIVTPVVGEIQGGIGTKCLIKHGIKADMAVVTEPFQEWVTTTHAGVMEIAITTIGKSQHISAKEKGVDAFEKMLKIIAALRNMTFTYTPDPRLPGLPRMIIGSIIGGHGEDYGLNGAAFLIDKCTIIVDIRFLKGMAPDREIEKLLEDLKLKDPELNYEMHVAPEDYSLPGMPFKNFRLRQPPQDLPVNSPIVKTVAKNHEEVTGRKTIVGHIPSENTLHTLSYAGADDALLTAAGIPALCYGPIGWWDGSEQWADIDSMMTVAKTLALTAYDVCTG